MLVDVGDLAELIKKEEREAVLRLLTKHRCAAFGRGEHALAAFLRDLSAEITMGKHVEQNPFDEPEVT